MFVNKLLVMQNVDDNISLNLIDATSSVTIKQLEFCDWLKRQAYHIGDIDNDVRLYTEILNIARLTRRGVGNLILCGESAYEQLTHYKETKKTFSNIKIKKSTQLLADEFIIGYKHDGLNSTDGGFCFDEKDDTVDLYYINDPDAHFSKYFRYGTLLELTA